MIWALARDLYLPVDADEGHAAYDRALAYYEQRAIPPELRWDWTGKESGLEEYGDLIDRSDEVLRMATVVLGAVVANHLLSAVDAFVSSRLARNAAVASRVDLRSHPGGPALEWSVELRP